MTDKQQEECSVIIHGASATVAAIAGPTTQFGVADEVLITPVQIGMVISLGKVFGLTISEGAQIGGGLTATTVLLGKATAKAARTASKVIFGWVPILGNVINAATAAGFTEWLGWELAKEFDEGKWS